MRTTLNLNDQLIRTAKRTAAERGTTLTALIEEALRRVLSTPGPGPRKARRKLHVFRGTGLRPGVTLSSTSALLDLLDDDAAP